MKKLTINIILFSFLLFAPLCLLHYAVNEGLKKCYFTDGTLNDIYQSKANADLLITGSSRAKNQYDPAIFDSILHTNSFNIGLSGYPFHLQYGLFRIYLQHNRKPDFIVQNIDGALLKTRGNFYEYEQFLPYANDTIVQRYTQELDGAFTLPERYVPLYRYNNHPDLVLKGLKSYFNIGRKQPPPYYKGYVPTNKPWDATFEAFKKEAPNGVTYYNSDTVRQEFCGFLSFCRQEHIKVILVYSPIYYEELPLLHNQQAIFMNLKSIADSFSIPLLDYRNDSIAYQKKYFYNAQHLNATGSAVFSRKLAQDLKPLINNK